jgi:type II secretory pathway pseudopilin PulG
MLRKGISLIEATMVVAVVGVSAAVGVPRYQDSVERARLSGAASRVQQDIESIRERARALGVYQTIAFAHDGYKVIERTATGESAREVNMGAEPYRAHIDWLSSSGGSELHFDGYGVPECRAMLKLSHAGRAYIISIGKGTGDVGMGDRLEGTAVAAADVGVVSVAISTNVASVVPEPRRVGKVVFNPLSALDVVGVGGLD